MGPIRSGKLSARWVRRGCRPCRARLLVDRLYHSALIGVMQRQGAVRHAVPYRKQSALSRSALVPTAVVLAATTQRVVFVDGAAERDRAKMTNGVAQKKANVKRTQQPSARSAPSAQAMPRPFQGLRAIFCLAWLEATLWDSVVVRAIASVTANRECSSTLEKDRPPKMSVGQAPACKSKSIGTGNECTLPIRTMLASTAKESARYGRRDAQSKAHAFGVALRAPRGHRAVQDTNAVVRSDLIGLSGENSQGAGATWMCANRAPTSVDWKNSSG